MSDVRDRLIDAIRGRKNMPSDVLADAILEKFEVTLRPEPPVISDEELGRMVGNASEYTIAKVRGIYLRACLADGGLEIVRKEVVE